MTARQMYGSYIALRLRAGATDPSPLVSSCSPAIPHYSVSDYLGVLPHYVPKTLY
jgi:hypothetical protein